MAIFANSSVATDSFQINTLRYVAITDDAANAEFSQGDTILGFQPINLATSALGTVSYFNQSTNTALALTTPTVGTQIRAVQQDELIALADEALTIDANAGGVALAAKPADANYAVVQVDPSGGAVRLTVSGDAPTAGVGGGVLQQAGVSFTLESEDELTNFLAIRETTTDGALFIQYYTRIA